MKFSKEKEQSIIQDYLNGKNTACFNYILLYKKCQA